MRLAFKTEPDELKLKIAEKIGYKYIEVYTSSKIISEKTLNLLKKFSFEYSVHAPIKYCDDSVFEFAKQLNAKTVTIHCTYTKQCLDELSLRSQEYNINLCLENEGVFGENNYEYDAKKPKELETVHIGQDFLNLNLPLLSLTFDTEHSAMRKSTDTFWPLVESGHIKHMHTSGYDGTKNSWHSPPLNNPQRFEMIIQKLLSLKYSNMLTIEMHMKFHTEEILKQHIEFYNSIVNKWQP